MSSKIIIAFSSGELTKFIFKSTITGETRVSFRGGKTCFDSGINYFPWSSGTKALALLLVRTRKQANSSEIACLEGLQGSPALTLDYAISKDSNWLSDIFGFDSSGRTYARRIFIRLNSNCKRPGPVIVLVNSKIIQPSEITIVLDGREIDSYNDFEGLELSLGKYWNMHKGRELSDIMLAA